MKREKLLNNLYEWLDDECSPGTMTADLPHDFVDLLRSTLDEIKATPSPSSATAEEILDNITCCTIDDDADLDDPKNFWHQHETVIKAMNKSATLAVAEATKDCYPKEFTKWFRSDEFYEIFNEGTDNEGLIQWEYMSSGQILNTLDDLYEYWKENEQ